MPIVGCVAQVLNEMIRQFKGTDRRPDKVAHEAWWKQIDEWRGMDCLKYEQDDDTIKPQFVIETLHKLTDGDAFITSDVGQHQMWAAQYYPFEQPRRWVNSGGLGTMGFGMPAAIGVQLAHPDATVACITGESSIQMCIQELATIRQYDLPIKIITLNNHFMGMVRQWQEFFYGNRYSESGMEVHPDFVKLAQAYGLEGVQVSKPGDVEAALREAMAMKDKAVFMDFIVSETENVYPMVPAGAGLNEMILL